MESHEGARKESRLRDMLLTLESRVVNLEESIGDMRDMLEMVEGHIDELDSMKEQIRDFVLDYLNSTKEKLMGRDDAFEAIVIALKKEIPELNGSSRFTILL
ncbi:hypothetical protein J1N35_021807 [Gossypium stocksii]|uniref:Uncharacterized protein n=1 Tax=Gossypium stocksii TaxID=47602 RepID=A0A9D3VF76_9ROSI|nr:hypothetical protein J1N35_021807 [Gossypium stocksii]